MKARFNPTTTSKLRIVSNKISIANLLLSWFNNSEKLYN